jgi:hypothetical protein
MAYVDCMGLLYELSWGDSEPVVDYNMTGELNETHRSTGIARFDEDTPPAETGYLETVLGAIGEVDNAIGGYRVSRLLDSVSAGEDVLPVECTQEWEDTGRVFVDGVVYHYTGKGVGSLHGITHIFHGETVLGARKDHVQNAAVLDLGNPYNAIQTLRRTMLVDYAEGVDLSIVGRNLGAYRYPYMAADETYREVIKALAYNPRGTMLGIKTMLDALLGTGKYEVIEYLPRDPCTIYVKLGTDLLLTDRAIAHAYMESTEGPLAEQETGIWQLVPLGADPVTRGGPESILWRDHDFFHEFITADRPSAFEITDYDGDTGTTPWFWVGDDESGKVTPNPPNYVDIEEDAGDTVGYYKMYLRGPLYLPETLMDWTISMNLLIPTGWCPYGLDQWAVRVYDGEKNIGWGLWDDSGPLYIQLCSEALDVGDSILFTRDVWHEVQIEKKNSTIRLYLDGQLVDSKKYSDFFDDTDSSPFLAWGSFIVADSVKAEVRSVGVRVHTNQDFEEYVGINGIASAAEPDYFAVASSLFETTDIGHRLQTLLSGITNAYGGNSNGTWTITSRISGTKVALEGVSGTAAAVVQGVYPKRITIPNMPEVFTFPDDLGRKIVLSNSSQGNDGNYIIEKLLQAGTLTDLATFKTPGFTERTNVCEVVTAAFVTEGDLNFKVYPNWSSNESNLPFIMSAASPVVDVGGDPYIRTRQPLPTCEGNHSVRVGYSRVLTAQILQDTSVDMEQIGDSPPEYSYYPFYITDPIGMIRAYLDLVTAAGVIPEYLID